jgi:hypothetical protein
MKDGLISIAAIFNKKRGRLTRETPKKHQRNYP